jgi:hypothetical protein
MVDRLRALVSTDRAQLIGKDLGNGFVVKDGDDFEYTDPIDGSVSKKQASWQSWDCSFLMDGSSYTVLVNLN